MTGQYRALLSIGDSRRNRQFRGFVESLETLSFLACGPVHAEIFRILFLILSWWVSA